MTGKYAILVENDWVSYRFEISRKFTVIRGDSARGKTYFCSLLESGDSVKIECGIPIVTAQNKDMIDYYLDGSNRIIVFDEDSPLYKDISCYSGKLVKSNNYFIIISRSFLKGVPYSMKEIYSFTSKTINGKTVNTFIPVYDCSYKVDEIKGVVITEDTKSGNAFYRCTLRDCFVYPSEGASLGGKSNVKKHYQKLAEDGMLCGKNVYIIIDSAVFGDEIEDLIAVIRDLWKVANSLDTVILTPESFEQLICCAKLGLDDIRMSCTYLFCNTEKYLSWERYYIALASEVLTTCKSKNTKYSKKKLYNEVKELGDDIIRILKIVG